MLAYLIEFRRRAITLLIIFSLFFLIFFYYSNTLFQWLIHPLIKTLPIKQGLIATKITSPFLTPLQLATNTALLTTTPFALIQGWRFVSPALYRHEKKTLKKLTMLSLLLFGIGILFGFYVALPLMFHFLHFSLPPGVVWMPEMGDAVAFITRMLFIFGLCFQVPLICQILVRLQWISRQGLKDSRPYVIVAAFTVGMLLTPPDVASQIMLALPLCLLYELGVWLSGK